MSDKVFNSTHYQANPGYLIFFDNVRVDHLVERWSTQISADGRIGTANFSFMYSPYLHKLEHTNEKGIVTSREEGIRNMTNVRVFVKNIFNGKYIQIFEGNLRAKGLMRSASSMSISFVASDYMTWLNRTIVPLAIPHDSFTEGHTLQWKAQGIDVSAVDKVLTLGEASFKGKTLRQFITELTEKTLVRNKVYSDKNTVSAWDNVISRIDIMGDIDPVLVRKQIMDFTVTSTATFVNSLYVAFNDVTKNLVFEFYQDRDGKIRIKPPFWNEKVLKSHVIEPSCIVSFSLNTDWSRYYTRVLTAGGLEDFQETWDPYALAALLPTGVYVGDTKLWSDYKSVYTD